MQSSADNCATENNEVDYIPCKPFLKWVGGKSQLLKELDKRKPVEFQTYFEPFLGGGAFYFHLQPTGAVLSDINSELINAYQVVSNNVEELIYDLKKHKYDEGYYYELRDLDRRSDFSNIDPVTKASRLVYLNKTGYNGLYRVNSRGHYNVPFGRYTNPNFCDATNLRACSRVLQSAKISQQSFLDILEQVSAGDFVYLDPPYVPLSKTASFTSYASSGFGEQQQKELRDMCYELDHMGVKFMLSNSATVSIEQLYKGFHIDLVQATRMVNSQASKRGRVGELIVRNYSDSIA